MPGDVRSRILIVDDEPEITAILSDVFSDHHDCTTAGSAEQALPQVAVEPLFIPTAFANDAKALATNNRVTFRQCAFGFPPIAHSVPQSSQSFRVKPCSHNKLSQCKNMFATGGQNL